jgi:hypothetical protein
MRQVVAGSSNVRRIQASSYTYRDSRSNKKVTIPRVHEHYLRKNRVSKYLDDKTSHISIDRDYWKKNCGEPALRGAVSFGVKEGLSHLFHHSHSWDG